MAGETIVTFEEFEQVEFGADDVELLQGKIIRTPPAVRDHADIRENLYLRLKPRVEWLRGSSPHLHFGEVHIVHGYLLSTEPGSWLEPDVSLTHPNQQGDRYYLGAPLIAFEIVSEWDLACDVNDKITEYLANGAAEVWIFYPKDRAYVYDRFGNNRLESDAVRTPLLPGIEIPFSEIF